jgi:hypothetical protein
MQRRPKARSFPTRQRNETDLTPEGLTALRPALAVGLRRSGDFYIGAGATPAVISADVAMQLIAIGFARMDGDRLVLERRTKRVPGESARRAAARRRATGLRAGGSRIGPVGAGT